MNLVSSLDYDLPGDLIASAPARPRESARLLVLDRGTGGVAHRRFSDLPGYLRAGDCLVLNETRVLPARLIGKKPSGGKAEILVLGRQGEDPARFRVLSHDLRRDQEIELPGGACARALGREPEGEWTLSLSGPPMAEILERWGLPPLPPYILKKRRRVPNSNGGPFGEATDPEDYQTVYAAIPGSVAAPTAGLHFSRPLLERLSAQGVRIARVVLHIGWGTFRPIACRRLQDHRMLPEPYRMAAPEAEKVLRTRAEGGRVVAVGTSAVRVLETLGPEGLEKGAGFASRNATEGMASLFIHPGHSFRLVDRLVTNFHLPRSTPLALACAFAGTDRLLDAYRRAIEENYRFYSYGDSMLIL